MDHGRQKRKKKREDVVKKKQKREKEWVKGRSYKHLCPLRSVHEFRQRGSQRKLCGFWVKAKEKNVFETFFCLFFVCEWWLFCALPFTLWMLNIEPAKNTEKRTRSNPSLEVFPSFTAQLSFFTSSDPKTSSRSEPHSPSSVHTFNPFAPLDPHGLLPPEEGKDLTQWVQNSFFGMSVV